MTYFSFCKNEQLIGIIENILFYICNFAEDQPYIAYNHALLQQADRKQPNISPAVLGNCDSTFPWWHMHLWTRKPPVLAQLPQVALAAPYGATQCSTCRQNQMLVEEAASPFWSACQASATNPSNFRVSELSCLPLKSGFGFG